MNERGRSVVSLSRYGDFWRSLRTRVGRKQKLMAVVKANAYGCGALQLSSYLEVHNLVDYLGVATCEEALELRQAGIELPILTFCEPNPEVITQCSEQGIELSVWSLETLKDIAQFSTPKPLKLHLNINTGMNRAGCEPNEVEGCVSLMQETPHLECVGVYTHFACAGYSQSETVSQITAFKSVIETASLPKSVLKHAANSEATALHPEAHFDMVRVGIQSYMDCVSLEAKVLQLRTVKPGDGVGYEHKYIAQKTTHIATVSMGYADGIPRQFDGKVLIKGQHYPVVGHVCMDMCMVDIGHDDIQKGDTVTFLGTQKEAEITLDAFSKSSKRIPYESLCAIGNRVERVYVT